MKASLTDVVTIGIDTGRKHNPNRTIAPEDLPDHWSVSNEERRFLPRNTVPGSLYITNRLLPDGEIVTMFVYFSNWEQRWGFVAYTADERLNDLDCPFETGLEAVQAADKFLIDLAKEHHG